MTSDPACYFVGEGEVVLFIVRQLSRLFGHRMKGNNETSYKVLYLWWQLFSLIKRTYSHEEWPLLDRQDVGHQMHLSIIIMIFKYQDFLNVEFK